jgi:hypothetical protein
VRLVLTGLVVCLLAGCGGDETIPFAEYADRVSAICRDAGEQTQSKVREAEKAAGKDVSKEDALRIDRTILAQEHAWLERFANLPEPDERQDEAARFEGKLREGVEAFEDHVEALERDDRADMEDALDRSGKAFDASTEAAKDLGLSGCATESE